MIRVGPAGWSYADWAGIVYPSPAPRGFDALVYISRYFDTVEVNSTFYRPATGTVAHSWARRVGHNRRFRFTAKLWRRFTHERDKPWDATEVAAARAGFDALQEDGVLGAVLLQFPWSFRNTDENRGWLDELIETFGEYPLVVEVRHATWNEPAFFRELSQRRVGFANIDQPHFRDSIRPSAHLTSPIGYIRVHGRNYHDWFRSTAEPHERYNYLYSADELKPWAERAREMDHAAPSSDIYVVTNNHFRGKGIANAVMLRDLIGGRQLPIPPLIASEYGEALASVGRRPDSAQASLF